MTSWYARPEVKLITKQWVKENCNSITERDMGLLHVLSSRKLLRRDQLERLYPKFASTDVLQKRLNMMYKKHIIDRIFPPVGLGQGTSQQYICLDRAGVLLTEYGGRYNKPISTDASGNKSLPMGWQHRVMLNEYECTIRDLAREQGWLVYKYEVEPTCNFGDKFIKPDIFTVLVNNGMAYFFFIEVDLATEDLPQVKTKINNYKDYYMSRSWLKEDWAKITKKPAFPRVVTLTEEGRGKRRDALRDHSGESAVRFLFGFHSDLPDLLRGIIKG